MRNVESQAGGQPYSATKISPAPASDGKPKIPNSVSSRLQRMFRKTTSDEALVAAEDKFDEAAEMVVSDTPAEIRQLSSCTLRMIFRVLLYGSYIFAVAYFFSTVYQSKLRATYLAADRDSGDCATVWTTLTGTHKLDVNGRWDTDPDYDPQQSLFVVDYAKLPAEDYQAAMGAVAKELRAIVVGEPRSLLEALLLAATTQIEVRGGSVSVSFDVKASSFMDLPTGTAGFAGCPGPIGADFKTDEANPSYQYDLRIEDGALVFSVDTVETFRKCQKTSSKKSLGDVLSAANKYNFWGKRNLELSVHLHSIAAATAINYGLIKPEDFMAPLDASNFELYKDDDDDDYDDDDDDDVDGYYYGDDGDDGEQFCEESGFSQEECGSYDSSVCACQWDDGQCWYAGGSCSGGDVDYAQYFGGHYLQDDLGGVWNNDDLQATADEKCEAYPQTSVPLTPKYFQDKRFPGMDPIICVDDADGKDVCSAQRTRRRARIDSTLPLLTIFASVPRACARRVRALRRAGELERGSMRRFR